MHWACCYTVLPYITALLNALTKVQAAKLILTCSLQYVIFGRNCCGIRRIKYFDVQLQEIINIKATHPVVFYSLHKTSLMVAMGNHPKHADVYDGASISKINFLAADCF